MSELFTAEKARELREQSVERILQEKRLEHENKIKKLIDETYSIQEILTNIQSFSYD
jgi:3-methyladenine DNA glycosylase Tag